MVRNKTSANVPPKTRRVGRPMTKKCNNDITTFKQLKEFTMAAIDNLNTNVTALEAELVVVQNAVAALKAGGSGGSNEAAIQSAADRVAAVTASLDSAVK